MEKYRFHLLTLPHLPQSKMYSSCAFTQKNRKLAKMLTSLGHEVFFYASSGSDVEEYCNSDNLHFVETHTVKDIAQTYGDGDNRYEIGYNWQNTDFRHDLSTEKTALTQKYYAKCIEEINRVKKHDDFLLVTQGLYHLTIVNGVQLPLTCESGIGYRGSCSQIPYHAWESAFGRNFSYGSWYPQEDIDGNPLDRVIPNYYDPADFQYSEEKNDFFLYMGRIIRRKGLMTAMQTCDMLGKRLIIVGQGGTVTKDGWLTATTSPDFQYPPGHWVYAGFANTERRKVLLSKAKAVFVPTIYMEQFGGVHVEAMLSGTPVITSAHGVFGDNSFRDGYHGFKCDTLDDYVFAAEHVDKLVPENIRKFAEYYTLDRVRWQYQRWFEDCMAHYQSEPGRTFIRNEVPEWRKAYYGNLL